MWQKDNPHFPRYRGRKHLPARNEIYKIHEYAVFGCGWRMHIIQSWAVMALVLAVLPLPLCEAHHDDYGPIWPMNHRPMAGSPVLPACRRRRSKGMCRRTCMHTLQKEHIEVIYDDRNVRPGVMFSDADLTGCSDPSGSQPKKHEGIRC